MPSKGGGSSTEPQEPIVIVVIGRTADGKSTLLKSVVKNPEDVKVKVWRHRNADGTINEGTGHDGTTREVEYYEGTDKINGRDVIWYDTPGIGDGHVGPIQLMEFLHERFEADSIDFLVVTHKLKEANLGTSRRIAQAMLDKGLVKEVSVRSAASALLTHTALCSHPLALVVWRACASQAWKNVIVDGTHHDLAEEEEILEFEAIVSGIFPNGIEQNFCYTRATEMGRNPQGGKNKDVRTLDNRCTPRVPPAHLTCACERLL